MTTEEDAGIDPYVTELLIQNMGLTAQIAAMTAEHKALRQELAKMQKALKDLAGFGLRFDLNPTVEWHGETEAEVMREGKMYEWWMRYMKRADESIRELAREALGMQDG